MTTTEANAELLIERWKKHAKQGNMIFRKKLLLVLRFSGLENIP